MNGEESLSYEEYLARVRAQEQSDRERFETGGHGHRPPPPPGHPFDGGLPPSGNAAYDAEKPYREAHSQSAMGGAGFDRRAMKDYRTALDRDPYGPRYHIVQADGTIVPAPESEGLAEPPAASEKPAGAFTGALARLFRR